MIAYIITCSKKLSNWFAAQGVPTAKLFPIPNGPGCKIKSSMIEKSKRHKRKSKNLNILFMGRLDPQKGLARLDEVYTRTKDINGVSWRFVGSSVVSDGVISSNIINNLEAPKFGSQELQECLCWADILILPSEYEGLPLVIKEAQALGVCVIATNVGAIDEAVLHGETGFIFDLDSYVKSCVLLVEELSKDALKLKEINERCFNISNDIVNSWESNSKRLIENIRKV
tara:strand:- start:1732 stop:2415 length:684 start_codon:yes stop_codon:yes gene_type:complete